VLAEIGEAPEDRRDRVRKGPKDPVW